jgi:RNA polymerase sigma-B factor
MATILRPKYTRGGEPFDDVFQVACIGFIKAVDRFDPGRGVA